jgi:hypothetical protein
MKSTALCAFVLLALSGCSSNPRFTHIDTNGRNALFIMFDQKTRQVCWGAPGYEGEISAPFTPREIENGPSITVTLPDGQTVKMPLCFNLK